MNNQETDKSGQDARIEQAETRTDQANIRTQEANTRTDQANTRTKQAEARTDQANTRTEEANTRTEQSEARSVQAILASELRYRRLFETAQDGILILDADTGQVVDANPFMKDLLGYSQAEFLGRKLWEIGPFKGEAASKIAFAELQQKDRIHYEGLLLETKDGRRVEVEFISNACLVDEKRLIQCNIRDITERKRAAAELVVANKELLFQNEEKEKRAAEMRRMATVVRDSNDAITIQDFEGKITAWNRGAELMYGYSEAEALAMNIERLTAPGKIEEQKDFVRRLLAGEAVTSLETQRLTKDGRVLDIWMTVTKLVDDAGKPIGIASTERDITGRKLALEEASRMATVVRDSNDAITIQDFEGRITAWNRGAERMFGYSEEEALQMTIWQLAPPDKAAEQKDFIRRIFAGEKVSSFETRRVTKDGHVLDVWLTVTKLVDDAGKPIGIASTERDKIGRAHV